MIVGAIPTPPAGPGNYIADFRTVIGPDGVLKFAKLGDIRSANVLGPFTVPVMAGPLTYDPFPLQGNRISGVLATPGVVGHTFHLDYFNEFVPPLVKVTTPATGAPRAIKALAFGKPTG
ncbi:MAG: hypothetical protein EXS31_08570 [Pedosphaera sp.]|nr:hypothetical protein [Pedosphaera sp.]